MGFDVEIGAWPDLEAGQWAQGNDNLTYPITYDFLLQPGVWGHTKNGLALMTVIRDTLIYCFSATPKTITPSPSRGTFGPTRM
jgi:hypothetical protein